MSTAPAISSPILSPGAWPEAERKRLEDLESRTFSPPQAQVIQSDGAIVSTTCSPIAAHAALQALKLGGSAADAAAVAALTAITTQLGSFVSYAGLLALLYYDAQTGKVHSLDAGFNSYLHETGPKSIPACDFGLVGRFFLGKFSTGPLTRRGKGRQTLVPGFMAGVEAMHRRFGRLPFRSLFEPAIWYAEHGVVISPMLLWGFLYRRRILSRTPEGRRFLSQVVRQKPGAKRGLTRSALGLALRAWGHPRPGDLFVQTDLARTLKAVSEQGARYMYSGPWAEEFVRLVQRDGGQVTAEDLSRYEPGWSEPYQQTVFGHTIYANGPPHFGAHALFAGLNLAEAVQLEQKAPYWRDPEIFQTLTQILNVAQFGGAFSKFLSAHGIDSSPEAQLGKAYAQALAPLLNQIPAPEMDRAPKHSDAIVVVDKEGNIAAVTHTINTLVWGGTGIVVGGIPLPDAAGFQQFGLARIKPGERVRHGINDTLAFRGDQPVLATAGVGMAILPETIRVLLGVLGQGQDLKTLMAAPPLLANFNPFDQKKRVPIPRHAYAREFVARLKALGMNVVSVNPRLAAGRRGTLAAVAIDPGTSQRSAVHQPKVMVFNAAE